jgi:hypothetical protein
MARTIGIADALLSLRPNAVWNLVDSQHYSTLQWLDNVQSKPTEQEVNSEITRLTVEAPLDACVNKAKDLLAASDWSVLSDVNISNKAAFETYRAELRTLMFNPIESPVFPTEPQPVWL